MELHSNVSTTIAKRLWEVLRVSFFMIRKGLVSKRKLIMDMNMMMKRGKLLWRKTLITNLMSHHHNHYLSPRSRGYGVQEYEFSCSNSPNPVFFRALRRETAHHYFPCIKPPKVTEDDDNDENMAQFDMLVPKTPDYIYTFDNINNAVQERLISPLSVYSPFSGGVTNYSSEDESVDDKAEEFIRRFYEQLRVQSRTQLLQYQDTDN